MGTNTLINGVDGNTITTAVVDQYKTAMSGDLVPRNSSGAAVDEASILGTDTYKWLKAYIASGYWTCGDIKPHYSFGSGAPIDQGWFPCTGQIINETNYDALFSSGDWAKYVIASPLNGKYSPNLIGKYLAGVDIGVDDQDGTSPLTYVGNANNQIALSHSHSHSHTVNSHNHKWYDDNESSGGNAQSYDSSGAARDLSNGGGALSSSKKLIFPSTSANSLSDQWTSNSSPGTSTDATASLTGNTDITPESLQVVYYIRII